MPHLDMRMLGPCRAFLNGEEVEGIKSSKIRGLLAYLVVEADAVHSRARLAALLWPDLDAPRALGYLRHALTNLRQVLNERNNDPAYLHITRTTLQFNRRSDHTLDVDLITAFDDAGADGSPTARLAAAQQAVDAYVGPFLDGFTIYACPDFEHWLQHTRTHLQATVLSALDLLASHWETEGDLAQARAHVDRELLRQPWRERAHQHKMRLLWQQGDRTAALRQYEQCVRALADELDVTPSPTTDALYAQIQHAPTAPPAKNASLPGTELSPVAHLPTELRAPLTSFIGRAAELAEIAALVQTARLVTLTGPGGVGKTRLALAVSQRVGAHFPDGVIAVGLASLHHPDFVWSAVADAIGINVQGRQSMIEFLAAFFAHKSTLLVLDNFEHLLSAAPQLADLLGRAPGLHVLATSRAPLQIHGEQEYPVAPLAVRAYADHDRLEHIEAVRFFADRVRQTIPGFQVTPTNAQTVTHICVALDGLPLALELAATRLKYMTTHELLDQLRRPTHLTWTGSHDASERQGTLGKTIAWSYRLLDDGAQRLMRTLGVFRGGFTLSAVQAVHAAIDRAAEKEVAQNLRALMNFSLVVRVDDGASTTRFAMLETIRQFAAQLLAESAADQVIYRAHSVYFLALAQSIESDILHLGAHPQLVILDAEDDNLRAALRWSLEHGASALALQLGVALGGYWITRFRLHEGVAWLESLLALPQCKASPRIDARLHAYRGRLLEMLGDYPRSRAALDEALALARAANDMTEIALALCYLGITARTMGDYMVARAHHEESFALYSKLDDRYGMVIGIKDVGICAIMLGDYAAAEQCFAKAIRLSSSLKDHFIDAYLLGKLGDAVVRQGRRSEGKEILRQSIERYRGLPSFAEFAALTYVQYGLTLLDEDDFDVGLDSVRTGLRIWASTDTFWGTTYALLACAQALAIHGQYARAWQIAANAVGAVEQAGAALQSIQQEILDAVQALVLPVLGQDDAATAWQTGRHLSKQSALVLALSDAPNQASDHA